MRYDPRFVKILFWETLENMPMLIGFLLAIRVQLQDVQLAFVILSIGITIGTILIHFTENKKHSNQPSPKETLVNFVIFMMLSTPFVFYFSSNGAWWSNWITDIIVGGIAGYLLSLGESWGWNSVATVKMHSISMAIALIMFLWGIRLTYELDSLLAILMVGVIFNLLVSSIIVLLDYWPIRETDTILVSKAEAQTAENTPF